MKDIVEAELSYKLTGLCFKVHKELGRFCRERQYGDALEEIFKTNKLAYEREYEIILLNPSAPRGNRADFLIERRLVVDIKAKNFITKEDYI